MKKLFYVLIFFLGTCFFGLAQAQDSYFDEAVSSLEVKITVHADNSVTVNEIVDYFTGSLQRHGIYRDIYSFSSTGRKMEISDITVSHQGEPVPFEILRSGDNVRIKIGDPYQTFLGERVYDIKYKVSNAVAQFENYDEIYWNATGNDWQIPILAAHAQVILPDGVQPTQSACYYGSLGSKDMCSYFTAPRILNPGEGMTIAVGFSKGVVAPYTGVDNASNFFARYGEWLLASILPVLTLIFCLRRWSKKGKDPKGTGVIVPQYDVPDGLTPFEVIGICNGKIKNKDFSAEIIYLATQGYLNINETEDRTLGIFKKKDYELQVLKDPSSLKNDFDKQLLQALFNTKTYKSYLFQPVSFFVKELKPEEESVSVSTTVKLSALKNFFYESMSLIISSATSVLKTKGYYKNLASFESSFGRSLLPTFGVGVLVAVFITISKNGGDFSPVIFSVFISFLIFLVVAIFMPARTEKGVAIMEYLLGLKMYLQIAEKDRLEFHNAPEKKPEVFEKLLPYAMVLGVADIWAKEFEGIYITPPSWYTSSSGGAFSAIAFNNSLSDFNSFATSSLSSTPGGSGGGGSSGGGGGGGGGGSW